MYDVYMNVLGKVPVNFVGMRFQDRLIKKP